VFIRLYINCRKLYWTEDGSRGNGKARIAQANLDGSRVSTLYGDVVRPTGLGIEFGLKEDRYDVGTDNYVINCQLRVYSMSLLSNCLSSVIIMMLFGNN